MFIYGWISAQTEYRQGLEVLESTLKFNLNLEIYSQFNISEKCPTKKYFSFFVRGILWDW